MSTIDIFNIQPSVISRDLSGKSFLIYGDKKSGKTSNAVKFPKPLLIAAEKGYNLLSGVYAQPVNKWKEMLDIKKQLLKNAEDVDKGKNTETIFKTIIVDTADLAYDMCEAYILQLEGVSYLDETESKRGYKAVEREYDKFFQEIVKAGYTLVVISHSTTTQIKENGEKYDRTQPTVDKRGLKVLARLVDVIGYSTYEVDENGDNEMVLHLRGSKELEAGSRNKYMSDKIPFTYSALLEDMQQAIDKLEKEDGATVVDKPTQVYKDQSEEYDYNSLVESIKEIATALYNAELTNRYNEVVAGRLGKGKFVRDCDESQTDVLALILEDLQDLITELEIDVSSIE